MELSRLAEQFGQIDIYLFDQILKGRIAPGMRILDAGCGAGRNLVCFLKSAAEDRYEIFGADSDPASIAAVRHLAASLAPGVPANNFRVESVEQMSFPDGSADLAISSAVLHFASSDDHFAAMVNGTWRVLKPGGLLFCRLASSIGIERQIRRIAGRRHLLPDGSERYLADEALLNEIARQLGAGFVDPIKTTVVQNQRSMTTLVLRKGNGPEAAFALAPQVSATETTARRPTFELFTEQARRVIFFARYEAGRLGSPFVETEHLLLGLLRQDKQLANRFLLSHSIVDSIRKRIEGHPHPVGEIATTVDLPLSHECRRALAHAAQEAEGLGREHIGTEHILLGLLAGERGLAPDILREHGLILGAVREEMRRGGSGPSD
jgi:ubiquinone/menaquinone biosynthesis C-methylase UbiE